jgi:hypothetical protein
MPVVREHRPDPDGEFEYRLEVCGHPLYIERLASNDLGDMDGVPGEGDGPVGWDVKCYGRHMLLTHETEDREAPLLAAHLEAVLTSLGAEGVGYDAPWPLEPELWPR